MQGALDWAVLGDGAVWIQLTGSDGQPISFNTHHLVLLKDHGEHTLVIHRNGAELVKEKPERDL